VRRIRSGLRRHGLVLRPRAIRRLAQRHRLRFTSGNRLLVFSHGADGLEAMLEAITSARARIHLETYILRADTTGARFLDALTDRAAAGVAVRVLYDAVGSRGLAESALEPLRRAGGDVVAFNPLRRVWPDFAPRRRDHRKILVIDGKCAFTGGLNIGDEYAHGLGEGDDGWRDTHVRVDGPAVRDLEAVFLESWFRADGPDIHWEDVLTRAPSPVGDVRCAVLADGPSYPRRRMRDFLVGALAESADRVILETPYFAPGRRVLRALSAAAQRGADIDLLLAGRTDHPILRRAARAILPQLLERGIRVHEYERAMMHAKVGVFDGNWAFVGTSNLDQQSLEHSFEVNLILEGGDVVDQLLVAFAADREGSRRVDRDMLARRGFAERALDRASAWLLSLY
jgi:cardiolipin synthase